MIHISMSLRKQYQEKIFKTHLEKLERLEKIQKIEEESSELFYLFEELYEEIKSQDKLINTIEESIKSAEHQINTSDNDISDSEKINKRVTTFQNFKKVSGIFIGSGLGGIVFLYNPYVAIGTIIGGAVVGGIVQYLL
jgi:hypothetical protein